MIVHVVTGNPTKRRAVEQVLREFEFAARVVVADIRLDLPAQPIGEDVERGAIQRARAAIARAKDPEDLGIGIEAGLIQLPSGRWLSTQCCAVTGCDGRVALGVGSGYVLPDTILSAVLGGETLRDAFERLLDVRDSARRGAIYYLSGGRVDRETLTREAVRLALVLRLAELSYGTRVPRVDEHLKDGTRGGW